MTFQLTTAQALKSFTGAAVFGLGMDMADIVSCHLTQLFWFALREVVSVLFWGFLAGWETSHAQALAHSFSLFGCPLQILHSLAVLAHFLGSAV